MNYFVLATHAVTIDGEWVTPDSVQQVDFDSLHCIYCKLKIGVQFDPLTTTKTFVHLLGHISNVARLKNVDSISTRRCRSRPHHKLYSLQKIVFILRTRLYGNGDVAGAMSAGMGRRDVLNVLIGFIQLMRK